MRVALLRSCLHFEVRSSHAKQDGRKSCWVLYILEVLYVDPVRISGTRHRHSLSLMGPRILPLKPALL